MPTFGGSYKAERDNQTYTYEATWTDNGSTGQWDAVVRRNGELVGRPNGVLLDTKGLAADLERLVRRLVEEAIEHRAGVE
jgi:hypothetical protein